MILKPERNNYQNDNYSRYVIKSHLKISEFIMYIGQIKAMAMDEKKTKKRSCQKKKKKGF
jgi:hypothetical protein